MNLLNERDFGDIMKSFKKIRNIKISFKRNKLYKNNGFNITENILQRAKNLLKEINILENEKKYNSKSKPIKNNKLTIKACKDKTSFIQHRKNEIEKKLRKKNIKTHLQIS